MFAIVFAALTQFVKTVFLASALVVSLFFGAVILILWILQR
jgi:hypothetical protein